ncbi:MAG TPA: hypothetical protein PLJ21_10505, partial [Pseudobdellovibrionaceae bacterium]|nr:hypothetical protein [Pseudobdellovibrionaceae bacterium]
NLTSTGVISTLILDHALGTSVGTLTLQNINLQNVTYSKVGSGLVDISWAPLTVDTVSVSNLTNPLGSRSVGGIVGKVYTTSSFSNITLSGYTMTSNCVTTSQGIGGIVGKKMNSTSVSNLTFSNIQISSIDLGCNISSNQAGIIGKVYDANVIITNSQVNGTIQGGTSGGYIGWLEAFSSASGTSFSITNSSFSGSVATGGSMNGGFVGFIYGDNFVISNSFVKGTVKTWNSSAGGLIGAFECFSTGSTITNSYSQASLLNTYSGGSPSGAIGGLFAAGTGELTIQNSYAIGAVTSPGTQKGCIAGILTAVSLTLTNVNFDNTRCTANAVNGGGYAGATGIATASFQTATPFTNWSSLLWNFQAGQDPKLIWEP